MAYVDFDYLYIAIIYLCFDDKECALMIPLYLMKFDLMGSMIDEWMHFLLFIDVLSNMHYLL